MEFVQEAFLLRRSLILPEVNHFPEDVLGPSQPCSHCLCSAWLSVCLPSPLKRFYRHCVCLAAELEIKS